jgi:beta-ribofuranosylaminobenzene 5'-phosphate synthase
MPDTAGAQRVAAVEIVAPARLHLGFLDLGGGLGRRFGSLGLAIDGFDARLRVTRAEAPDAAGPDAARARDYVALAAAGLGVSPNVRVTIATTSPAHAGFGSGTQLALAVASALARLNGIALSATDLAATVGRGARSGVGVGVFERGGFVLDGGRRVEGGIAPILLRLPFPSAWRLLLALDPERRGLHGQAEASAFTHLPSFAEALSGRLCREVLLRLLPGLVEQDFAAVSLAIGEMQRELGDYFSGAQRGRYTSPRVGDALAAVAARGMVGVGQSSWGPTGFALMKDAAQAEAMAATLSADPRFAALQFRVVVAANRGADVITD